MKIEYKSGKQGSVRANEQESLEREMGMMRDNEKKKEETERNDLQSDTSL